MFLNSCDRFAGRNKQTETVTILFELLLIAYLYKILITSHLKQKKRT